MALYTLKNRDEVLNPLINYKGNENWVRNQMSTMGYGPSAAETTMYNMLGRDAGSQSGDNFFTKRAKSVENAIGTTLAAPASFIYDSIENAKTDQLIQDSKDRMQNIAKKYGYNSTDDFWDAKQNAEKEVYGKYGYDIDNYWNKRSNLWTPSNNDSDELKALDADRDNAIARMNQEDADRIRKFNSIESELRDQAASNAKEATDKAKAYEDYRKNNYVSQKINQDRGKFAGSAINTLSTAADVGLMAAGVPTGALFNGAQGAIEGVADELEQNGLENFDWGRAGQNAAIGAASGLATGALNKTGIVRNLGQGKISQALLNNKIGNKLLDNSVGRGLRTVGTGAVRGALSGAVGGATGAGLSAAMNNQDIMSSALQGAAQGAQQGALTGGIMAGANMATNAALNKVAPDFMEGVRANQARNAEYGDTMREQWRGAVESGDSAVANKAKALLGRTNNVDTAAPVANTGTWVDLDNMIDRSINKAMPNANAAEVKDALLENVANKLQNSGVFDSHEAGEISDADYRNYAMAAINDSLDEMSGNAMAQPTATRQNQTIAANTEVSPWDRVAQESGYASYDDAINRFKQANPGVEVGANDAGKILTWMDNNPGEWNPNAPQTTAQATKQSIFEPEARNQIQSRNKLQSVGEQLQNAANTQKYGSLYDSLDAKTASRAVQTGAPQTLSDLGVAPENYLEAAKTSNYVNKVVSDLAEQSGVKVNVSNMPARLEAVTDDVILTENAAKKYNNIIKQIVPDGSTPDEYSAGYLLQKSREIGNKAANLTGNTDDVRTLRQALTNAKYELRNLAADALETQQITSDATNQNIAKGLAKMGANEKIQGYYTEPVDGKAPTVSDYIRRSALFEQARDMGTQVDAEKYTRSASKASTNPATKIWNASGLDQPVNTILRNTVAPIAGGATRLAGKVLEGVGNIGAKISGKMPTTTTSVSTPVDTGYNPATQVYNMIGRDAGERQGEQQRVAEYLTQAANDQTDQTIAGNTLEGLVAPLGATTSTAGEGSTSVYNSVYGNNTPTTSLMPLEEERAKYFFPPTGDYWTDMLSQAMRNAKNAEDYDALGSLYEMYTDAVAKTEKEATKSTTQTKLTDKQRQANAAARALDDFETAEHNFAYDVSDIPLIGGLANLGGNTYASKAEALALQIGYMLSGATVNKEEAKNIGMAYVPQPRDNEQVRKNKLEQLRGIISDYQKTYQDE